MSADVVVVGAGYWGAAAAARLRGAGRSVILLDEGRADSGSRNASAVCDPAAYRSDLFRKYWPSDWSAAELADSLEWLVREGGGRKVREWFWNRGAGTAPREGGECIYLDDPDALARRAGPRMRGRVLGGSAGAAGVTLSTDRGEVSARWVVVAAGAWTDDVLRSLGLPPAGVTGLYGRGLIVRGAPRPGAPVPVSVMIRPYCKHTVREWPGGLYRVGDTAERRPDPKHRAPLLSVAEAVLGELEEIGEAAGLRPVSALHFVEKVGPRAVAASGGHRVGLGLAGLVARRVEEALR